MKKRTSVSRTFWCVREETERTKNIGANVHTHTDIFSGLYTSLGRGDVLVRMLRSWEKILVDQRRSRHMYQQVKYSFKISHVLHARVNIDIFRGMYTSLGTGGILVRMCGSWEKIMVDQRRSRRFFTEVQHSVLYIELSHDVHACVNVLLHIDIFRPLNVR